MTTFSDRILAVRNRKILTKAHPIWTEGMSIHTLDIITTNFKPKTTSTWPTKCEGDFMLSSVCLSARHSNEFIESSW